MRAPLRASMQDGAVVLLEDQDRGNWNAKMIAEGLALIDKAMRHRRPGPYQIQAAIAALHARAGKAGGYGLGADRPALRRAGGDPAVARRHAQPRCRRLQVARTARPRST